MKHLETQANQSATAVQKIATAGEKLKTTGDNISSAGQKLLPVTAGVTALGTASVTTAANFESAMSQAQATMGITKDNMSTVDDQSVNTMNESLLQARHTQFKAKIGVPPFPCTIRVGYVFR